MAAAGLRDPLLRLYLALGVVLLPVVVLLAEAYPGYEERMRRAAGTPKLEAIPGDEVLQEQVVGLVPDAAGCTWRVSYAPEEEPATGIARAYDLSEGPNLRYRFLVVRHDIACGVCRDLLAAQLSESPGCRHVAAYRRDDTSITQSRRSEERDHVQQLQSIA